ncbi:hypothetical protein GCM10027406_25960 [Leifsonia lichenia]
MMTGAWVTGKGPKKFTFEEDDAFTKVWRNSDRVKAAMELMRLDIVGQGATAGVAGGLSYSVPAENIFRDAATIASGGTSGNLPEAFVSSFAREYEVLEVKAGRSAQSFGGFYSDIRQDIWWRQEVILR